MWTKQQPLPMHVEAELLSPLATMLVSDLLPKPVFNADALMEQAMKHAALQSLVESNDE